MDENDKKRSDQQGVSRRTFLGAAGLAAGAAILGPLSKLSADDSSYYYLNSFGDIVPVSQDLIDMGVFPPPFPEGTQPPVGGEAARRRAQLEGYHGTDRMLDGGGDPSVATAPVSGYPKYNILLIMVDQLRTPRWVPQVGGLAALQALTPNITKLQTQSFTFPNFFVNATACTPSRSTLLTGLYTQQTCMFRTQADSYCEPDLNVGFQNIATVLGQSFLGMQSFWVGKWHLSDPAPNSDGPGKDGPLDYGFFNSLPGLNFPPSKRIASPNGGGNTGSEGFNPAPGPYNHATYGSLPTNTSSLGNYFYNDAAICDYFLGTTAPFLANYTGGNWFAAVSFLNPHDITQFPYFYNLSGQANFMGTPNGHSRTSYPPPLTIGSVGNGSVNSQTYGDTYLPALPTVYPTSAGATGPTGWNYADSPAGYMNGSGKPDMQIAFQNYIGNMYGYTDGSAVSWSVFLNYYFWMQSCVDFQIGRILQYSPPAVLNNSIIVFLSDHGDYGGSHNMHAKAGAIYDESINVPLFVSYPSMRPANYANGGGPYTVPYVCSMVDILPYFYAQSLGSEPAWRRDSNSVVSYLAGRESILDAILGYSSGNLGYMAQRRISTIPNEGGNSYSGQRNQPYILTTTDEFAAEYVNFSGVINSVPTHIVGFRTVDLTNHYQNADGINVYGGGKLGIYSYWPTPPSSPNTSNVNQTLTQPLPTGQQYEFYDYYTNRNYPEVGNEWATNPLNSVFLAAFNNVAVQNELYPPGAFTTSLYNAFALNALVGYAISRNNSSCSA